MLNSNIQPQRFSDATIRRFLLAQLSRGEQSGFETALLTNSQLEYRARLIEIELIDDYAANRLRANERAAFQQKFLATAARHKKLEISAALQRSLANGLVSQQTSSKPNPLFTWPRLAWRIAFSILALAVLLASVMVIRREPQIVRKVIPKRWRPIAVVTQTPQPAHHATSSPESAVHREDPPPMPAHEASPQTTVLPANSSPGNPPVVSLANNASKAVRLELMLERNESATFGVVVTTGGEVVYSVLEIPVENTDRIDIDVPVDRLKPGDFQLTLTRLNGEASAVGIYYFRVL